VVKRRVSQVTRASLLTRHAISPYIGMDSAVEISATYLRGCDTRSATQGKFLAPAAPL
jgi:dihydroorotase-like cyclic amidohydrolase